MHSYPHNSPEAAARIAALVLISDCNIGSAEFDAMNQPGTVGEPDSHRACSVAE